MRRRVRLGVAVVAFAAATSGARRADACGVSSPDGASLCAMAAGAGPKWRVSASGIYTSTRLRFTNGPTGDETRGGALVALGYQLTPALSVQSGLGPSFGGAFHAPNGKHEFQPGLLGLLGASYRVYGGPKLDENGEGYQQNPFVVLTSALAFNITRTKRSGVANESPATYEAYDVRFGVVVGTTLADRFRPYALARVFGGPVFWRYENKAIVGTDLYHYQLGAGLSVAVGKGFSLYAEGVPLGERGVSGGAVQSF